MVSKDDPTERQFDLSRDIAALEAAILSCPGCKLVVIDPISAYLGGKADSHNNTDVRGVLAPLAALAERHGVAVLCISHLSKSPATPAVYRTLGSIAFIAAARAAFLVARSPTDPDGKKRLMIPVKNNLGNDSTGLEFVLSAIHSGGQPIVEWSAVPVDMSADEALAPPERRRGPDPDERDEAEEFLAAALADGPRLAREVFKAAKAADISERTLRRAKKTLGVEVDRDKVPGPWYWRLQGGHDNDKVASLKLLGNLGHLGESPRETTDFEPQECKVAKLFEPGILATDEPNDDWGDA